MRTSSTTTGWLLKVAVWSLPFRGWPIEFGWLVAEYGRQPWVVEGVLPTFYAASGLDADRPCDQSRLLRCTLHGPRHHHGLPDAEGRSRQGPAQTNALIDGVGGSIRIPDGATATPER